MISSSDSVAFEVELASKLPLLVAEIPAQFDTCLFKRLRSVLGIKSKSHDDHSDNLRNRGPQRQSPSAAT